MHSDFSRCSTGDLLQLTTNRDDKELAHKAMRTLFKRWDGGIDVSYLIDFIDTENINARLRGADFLFEVSPRIDSVKDAVLKLADDPLAECRRAFAGYLRDAGWYDDTAAEGLVNGIQDFDIRVRLRVIEWAATTSDERFAHFSARVINTATGDETVLGRWRARLEKRGRRALEIAARLRRGDSVAEVRATTPDEDGYTFDYLGAFETIHRRQRDRSRSRRRRHPPGACSLYGWS